MKAKSSFALSLCLIPLFLAGCTQSDCQCPEAMTPEQPSASATQVKAAPKKPYVSGLEGAIEVRSVAAEGKARPLQIKGGQTVSGVAVADRAGMLVGFAVTIGNYRNKSDGTLTLSLCQRDACQDVVADLPTSRNNELLHYKLPHPIGVAAGEAISFKLVHNVGALEPVAVWTYPPVPGASTLLGVDGTDTGRVTKFAMYFQK